MSHATRRRHCNGFRRLAVVMLAAMPAFALAQAGMGSRAAPHLAYVYPAGANQGTKLVIHVGGQNLAGTSAAQISGTGVAAQIADYDRPLTQKEVNDLREKIEALRKIRDASPAAFPAEKARELATLQTTLTQRNNRQAGPSLAETVSLELTLAADAKPGTRELRLMTAGGLSNPLVFQVGTLPEFGAPVVTATSPGAARNRRAEDNTVRASPPAPALAVTLPAVVNGQILPGEVDRIRFPARRGQQIVAAVAARELIPYLADAVPGWFQASARLCDAQGHELAYNDDFAFRPDPVLVCTIPADGDYVLEITDALYRGREDFVYRVSLGELPFVRSVFPLGVARSQPAEIQLAGWNLPSDQLRVDAREKPAGIMHLFVNRNGVSSNRVRFAVSDTTELIESPSAEPMEGTLVPVPAVFNGRISVPGERDVVRFRGRKGDPVVAEIFARRLDSPLDSHLELRDARGAVLAANDDYDDRTDGLVTHQADSRLVATLPADGVFSLVVTDTQHRGSADFGYRLSVEIAQPDFELRVTPSALNIRAGSCTPFTVFAMRHNGFGGEIALSLRHAPAGFTLNGARIPAGRDSIQLTLAIPGRDTPVSTSLALVGTATIAGKAVSRIAVPADDTMQAFLYRHLVPASDWQIVTTGRGLSVRLAQMQPCRLEADRSAKLRLLVPYLPRAVETVSASLVDPPPGISIVNSRLLGGNEVEVELRTEPCSTVTEREGNLIIALQAERGKPAGNNARAGQNLTVAPAIPYLRTIKPAAPGH